jgi:hypothetical protein
MATAHLHGLGVVDAVDPVRLVPAKARAPGRAGLPLRSVAPAPDAPVASYGANGSNEGIEVDGLIQAHRLT